MAEPSERLVRRIRQDFSTNDACRVIEALRPIPDCFPLGANQDPERLQAAVVLTSDGNYTALQTAIQLGHADWRDLLMNAGLEHSNWPSKLDVALGPP